MRRTPRRGGPSHATAQAVAVRACLYRAQSTSRASRAKRPQGRAARSLKKRSSAVDTPHSSICSPGTPPSRSCWRFAATEVDEPVPRPVRPRHPGVQRHGADRARQGVARPRRSPGSARVPRPARRTPAPARGARPARPWRPARRRPRPAAVPRHPACTAAEDAGDRVDQRHRHAVGHHDHQRHAGRRGHEDVGLGRPASSSAGGAPPARRRRSRAPRAPRAPAGRTPARRARRRTPAAARRRFSTTASGRHPRAARG